jgi:DNA-directed RNA polymerase subunit RPC12/RpoP
MKCEHCNSENTEQTQWLDSNPESDLYVYFCLDCGTEFQGLVSRELLPGESFSEGEFE